MRLLILLALSVQTAFSFTGVFKPALNVMEDGWDTTLTARFMEKRNLNFARFEAAWAVSPSAGDPAQSGPAENYTSYRIMDFQPDITENENFSILQNLDRLSLQFRPGKFRITVGRQAIYWGISKSVSPTDFIAPFPYGTIDTQYRVGVDGIRIVHPTGVLSDLETGAVLGDHGNDESNGYWLRGRFYHLQTDITVQGARYRQNLTAGGSLNRAVLGAVAWVEGAYSESVNNEGWWSLSTGMERSFLENRVYGYAEYHYNSAGKESELSDAYTTGSVYLLDEHYAAIGGLFTASPLLTLSAGCLLNMEDGSSQVNLDGEYSLSDNSSISAGLSSGVGENETEFGPVPFLFHCMYSVYFR